VVVTLVVVFSLAGGGKSPTHPVAQANSGATTNAAFDTQDYKGDDSVSVKVPAGWTRTPGGSYVDYVNPQNKLLKVRVLVEKGSISPRRFADSTAPATLRKSENCPAPFKHLGTTDEQVDGHAGAQFEYTCGTGDGERHGVWRMTTVGGKMYSFFLTSPQADFPASKKYFDEMANTFKLGT
jgi:hypothetical protein